MNAAVSGVYHQLRQTKVLRGGETRPVGHSNVLPKIITRKVKVKQVDQASIVRSVEVVFPYIITRKPTRTRTGTVKIKTFKHGSKGKVSHSKRHIPNEFQKEECCQRDSR